MDGSLDHERGGPLLEDQEVVLEMPEAPEESVVRFDVMNVKEMEEFNETFSQELAVADQDLEEYEGVFEEINSEVAEKFWDEGEKMTHEHAARRLSFAERAVESSQMMLATLDLDTKGKAAEAALGLVPMLTFLQGFAGKRIKIDGGMRLEPMKPAERMVAMASDLMPIPGTGFVLDKAYKEAAKRGLEEKLQNVADEVTMRVTMKPTVQSLMRAFT